MLAAASDELAPGEVRYEDVRCAGISWSRQIGNLQTALAHLRRGPDEEARKWRLYTQYGDDQVQEDLNRLGPCECVKGAQPTMCLSRNPD